MACCVKLLSEFIDFGLELMKEVFCFGFNSDPFLLEFFLEFILLLDLFLDLQLMR